MGEEPTMTSELQAVHLADLPEKRTPIVDCVGGETRLGLEGADKFDTAYYVTYRTQECTDIYFSHAAHQEFISSNKAHWEDVLVVDSEIAV
jgi:hypothetical protein